MTRPPYLRWAAATALVLAALAWDLRPEATTAYPFATTDLHAGVELSVGAVEYRQVPAGLFPPPPRIDESHVLHATPSGSPILSWAVSTTEPFPEGWWAVPITLPDDASVGDVVRLVWSVGGAITAAEGVVARSGSEGLVAMPAESSAEAADASRRSEVTVLVRTGR